MGRVTHSPESEDIKDFALDLEKFLEENSSSKSLLNEQQCEKEGELNPEIQRTKKRTAELISETVECEHPGFSKGLCVQCGQIVNKQSDVQLEYMHKMGSVTQSLESGISEDFGTVLDQWREKNLSSESLPNEPQCEMEGELLLEELCNYNFTLNVDQQCEKEGDLDPEALRTKKRTAELISETVECEHPDLLGGLCVQCGQIANGKSDINKKLKLSKDEIARIRESDMERLLHQKKLYLVLDLDHTLVDTIATEDLTAFEKHPRNQTDTQDFFVLKAKDAMTKLRPFVHTFLKEASKMFDMYLYTTGSSPYALEMAKLLDPKLEYFNSKVISSEEGTEESRKNLDILMGRESVSLILADTKCVWPGFKDNLIAISKYHAFYKSRRNSGLTGTSVAEGSKDESEICGALYNALNILKNIHGAFFRVTGYDFAGRDVRKFVENGSFKDVPEIHKHKTLADLQLALKTNLKTSKDRNQTNKSSRTNKKK